MKPQSYDECYPGRFLKAGLVVPGQTLRITAVDTDELESNDGVKMKTILSFDAAKPLITCKTSGICLREMFGNRPQVDWVGKRIVLFAAEWAGEPCVRIWGSPDIAVDQTVLIALPKKKPFTMLMRATGAPKAAARPAPAQAAPAEPKTERRPEVKAYLAAMKEATELAHLDPIEEGLVNADNLTPDETQFLAAALAKRQRQLKGEP